jgi:hypothetical protein
VIYPYVKSSKVYICPSDASSPWGGTAPAQLSYGYNEALACSQGNCETTATAVSAGRSLAKVAAPAQYSLDKLVDVPSSLDRPAGFVAGVHQPSAFDRVFNSCEVKLANVNSYFVVGTQPGFQGRFDSFASMGLVVTIRKVQE